MIWGIFHHLYNVFGLEIRWCVDEFVAVELLDVFLHDCSKGIADFLDDLKAAILAHLLNREVGMAACPVPVALLHRFGLDCDHATVRLADAEHGVAGNGQVVVMAGQGTNGDRRNDVWSYSVISKEWKEVSADDCSIPTSGSNRRVIYAVSGFICSVGAILLCLKCLVVTSTRRGYTSL